MNMRATGSYLAGLTSLVDKRIGDAFPIVEDVYKHLKELTYVAHNMEAVQKVAEALSATTTLLAPAPTVANNAVLVPYPVGVTQDRVLSSSVMILGTDGYLYGAETFVSSLSRAGLVVTLGPGSALIGGQIRWHLTYGV